MNIVLKELRFSNMFSYGANNCIKLNDKQINQLSAVNGSGKTSLALVIQELLFSKNVKGIKKTDIINRYISDKSWEGELDFSIGTKEYTISVKRTGASTKVKLLEDDIDISEHKVLDTYKKLQDILNIDFSVFSQLTYQSSTDLLDFLKATDTNRKKFLINLFNLERYIEIGEQIKKEHQAADKEVTALNSKLNTINSFLQSVDIPEYKSEIEVPSIDDSLLVELSDIENQLRTYADTCKRIDKNNFYIKEKNSLKFDMSVTKPEPFEFMNEYQALKLDIGVLNNSIADKQKAIKNLKLIDKCPSCGQSIDNSHQLVMKQELETDIVDLTNKKETALTKARAWSDEIKQIDNANVLYNTNQKAVERFEQLIQLIDSDIATEYPDTSALTARKSIIQTELQQQKKASSDVINHNKQVSAHNAKVEALKEQKAEFIASQQHVESDILEKVDKVTYLNVLKKAFSTSGIVAFKLENLTKELEVTINYYLSQLSDGQFQIEFLLDKEKLNISVIDNGKAAPIETVSGGEFSRIQTAILLAIRSLLSKLGGSSINLLFLDEIMAVLDDEGKENLIQVLMNEENLNVFLISHEYEHPLIPKTLIQKTNDISSIVQ